uniref:Uncharacterized protein n=1 Tax=Arundo donax TaxID=35708 RepID=A0A0A8ZH55_ARUDO
MITSRIIILQFHAQPPPVASLKSSAWHMVGELFADSRTGMISFANIHPPIEYCRHVPQNTIYHGFSYT